MIKSLPRPKPASSPEVIEFLRELLITAYNEDVEAVIYGLVGRSGLEANGCVSTGTSNRQIDRVLDLLEDWASDYEFDSVVDCDEGDGE